MFFKNINDIAQIRIQSQDIDETFMLEGEGQDLYSHAEEHRKAV